MTEKPFLHQARPRFKAQYCAVSHHPLRYTKYHPNFSLLISTIFVVSSYLVLELSRSPTLFYMSCAFISCICGCNALENLFKGTVNIGTMMSSQTILWYALPFSYIGFFGYEEYVPLISQIQSAQSVTIVAVVASINYFLFDKIGKTISIKGIYVGLSACLPLILPILLAQTILIAAGSRGYANVVGAYGERELSIHYQFVAGFSVGVMPICCSALATTLKSQTSNKLYSILFFIFALSIQILWWSTAGRRQMTIISILSFVSFFMIYYRGRLDHKKVTSLIGISLIAAPLLWFSWETYYLLRIATDASNGSENLSFLDLQRARQLAVGMDSQERFIENIIIRPFQTITSLAVVRDSASGILWGWNAASQLFLTIPSALFPNKFEAIGPVLENLWSSALNVPLNDWVNTILIESYIDFGWIGFTIYAFLLINIYNLLFICAFRTGYATITLFSYFSICFYILNSETTLVTLLASARSTMVIILLGFALSLWKWRFRSRQ